MPAAVPLQVHVVFKDRLPWVDEKLLQETLAQAAQAIWAAQGGPSGRTLTLYVDDREGSESRGTHVAPQQTIRLFGQACREGEPPERWVRRLMQTLSHEVTHAVAAAEREARGEEHPQDRAEVNAERERYLEDPEERRARMEERASDLALYPGLEGLPRLDGSKREAVDPRDAHRYQVAYQTGGIPERVARLEATLRPERAGMASRQPLLNPRGDQVKEVLEPLLARVATELPEGTCIPLDFREQALLANVLQFHRSRKIVQALIEVQEERGVTLMPPHQMEPEEWQRRVEAGTGEYRAWLAGVMVQLLQGSPEFQARERPRLFEYLRGTVEREREMRRSSSKPGKVDLEDETTQFYRQVVLGRGIEPARAERLPERQAEPETAGARQAGGMEARLKGLLQRTQEEARALDRLPQVARHRLGGMVTETQRRLTPTPSVASREGAKGRTR